MTLFFRRSYSRCVLFSITLLLVTSSVFSQVKPISYELAMQGIVTSNETVPFWMRSNQYGSLPMAGVSSSFLAGARKDYYTATDTIFRNPRHVDWGMGFEGRVNSKLKNSQFILIEAYLKGRLGPFELKAGRSKETIGLTGDTLLSSGSFAVSGNALGIPKLEISWPEFHTLQIFDSLFSFKGNFAHGWLGNIQIRKNINPTVPPYSKTYYHQKSFYGRIGKKDWKLKLVGGFNHQVFWGNEKNLLGDKFNVNNWKRYKMILTGSTLGIPGIPSSKIGNHLGTIDLGMEYELDKINIKAARQFLYDAGALGHFANILDGLTGFAILNKKKPNESLYWKKLVFELLYTKNQGGELWSPISPSGDDDYYNNYIYWPGWSYNGNNLGTSLLTTRDNTRRGLKASQLDYFINNRVIAFHVAANYVVKGWNYKTRAVYSKNYGTFKTSEIGSSQGNQRNPPVDGIFMPVQQFSFILEGSRRIKKDLEFSYSITFDHGRLLNESQGIYLKLNKNFGKKVLKE